MPKEREEWETHQFLGTTRTMVDLPGQELRSDDVTEEEAKSLATKFALEMCRETRRTVIEECAKVADRIAETYNDPEDAAERVAAQWIASEIRTMGSLVR